MILYQVTYRFSATTFHKLLWAMESGRNMMKVCIQRNSHDAALDLAGVPEPW
jgi:hypothetical protein